MAHRNLHTSRSRIQHFGGKPKKQRRSARALEQTRRLGSLTTVTKQAIVKIYCRSPAPVAYFRASILHCRTLRYIMREEPGRGTRSAKTFSIRSCVIVLVLSSIIVSVSLVDNRIRIELGVVGCKFERGAARLLLNVEACSIAGAARVAVNTLQNVDRCKSRNSETRVPGWFPAANCGAAKRTRARCSAPRGRQGPPCAAAAPGSLKLSIPRTTLAATRGRCFSLERRMIKILSGPRAVPNSARFARSAAPPRRPRHHTRDRGPAK